MNNSVVVNGGTSKTILLTNNDIASSNIKLLVTEQND